MEELAALLGRKTETLTLNGKTWDVEPFDFNDLIDIEARYGSLREIDAASAKGQRFVVWLALRKADPTLTPAQREYCEYNMTEAQAGKLMLAGSKETLAFVIRVLKLSAILGDANDEDAKKNEGETAEANGA